MLLCYLAVQRYNFFLENKIFPNIFGQNSLTEQLFRTRRLLINENALEITLKIGFVYSTALLRVNLHVGCGVVLAVCLLGGPNLVDKEDCGVLTRLINLISLATLLLQCLYAALEERVAQRCHVLGLHLAHDVEQKSLSLGLLGLGNIGKCKERNGAH